MYLTHEERQVLLSASANGTGSIDSVVSLLRQSNPAAFHTEASLSSRVFFDQPLRNEPCKGFRRFSKTREAA